MTRQQRRRLRALWRLIPKTSGSLSRDLEVYALRWSLRDVVPGITDDESWEDAVTRAMRVDLRLV